MPRMKRTSSAATRRTSSTPSVTHLDQLTTEVLRLRCDQQKLPATGSRATLLARLRDAPRPAENMNPSVDPEPSHPISDTVATALPDQEPTRGGFTNEQFETLQSLISSSLRDVTLPQASTITALPEPDLPATPPLFPPHLPDKSIASIRNGEYIDFNTLLFENVDGHDEQLRISFNSLGGSGVSIPVSVAQQKRQRIDSVDRWLTAFNIFARVVVHFFPYKASELFAYQQTIRDAQRKFSGMAWYAYDIAFRKKAANDASLSWAQRDPQLYLEKFTGLAKTACHACGSADHFTNTCPIAPNRSTPTRPRDDLCRNYNKKFPCASNPCPFKHRCNRPGCVGHHPGAEHDERAGESSNSRRER